MIKHGKYNTKNLDNYRLEYAESEEFREAVDSIIYLRSHYDEGIWLRAKKLAEWAMNHHQYKLN